MVLLVLFAPSSTNIDPFMVLFIMSPKQDRVYALGRSKSVAPSAHLVIGSDDERDLEYVPQALPLHTELHVLPEPHPKKWRPA